MHALTEVGYPAIAASAFFMDLRYCTGQVVLDNGIQRNACRFMRHDEDPRERNLLLFDERIRKLLLSVLAMFFRSHAWLHVVLLIILFYLRATDRRGNAKQIMR